MFDLSFKPPLVWPVIFELNHAFVYSKERVPSTIYATALLLTFGCNQAACKHVCEDDYTSPHQHRGPRRSALIDKIMNVLSIIINRPDSQSGYRRAYTVRFVPLLLFVPSAARSSSLQGLFFEQDSKRIPLTRQIFWVSIIAVHVHTILAAFHMIWKQMLIICSLDFVLFIKLIKAAERRKRGTDHWGRRLSPKDSERFVDAIIVASHLTQISRRAPLALHCAAPGKHPETCIDSHDHRADEHPLLIPDLSGVIFCNTYLLLGCCAD